MLRACGEACRELSEGEMPAKAISVTVVAVVKYLGFTFS